MTLSLKRTAPIITLLIIYQSPWTLALSKPTYVLYARKIMLFQPIFNIYRLSNIDIVFLICNSINNEHVYSLVYLRQLADELWVQTGISKQMYYKYTHGINKELEDKNFLC